MDEVQEIKDKLDIVEVISSYLTLKKAGVNLKGNCPFHNEKTPSFMVSQERQTFKCFGCGEGGDIFTFIEKMEGVDFYNALKILSDKAGIELKRNSVKFGEREYKSDKKTRLFEINDWAKRLYHKILLDHPKAENGRKYIKKRGMAEETVKEFEIGYAPKSWDLLIKFLKKKGYEENEMVQAGLAIRNEKGSVYDRFRGRIIFPINNIMGLTVAFTSRLLEDDPNQAKYINSAESPIYTKGKIIYGLDKAKMAIKESNLAVLVEGNMDVIACHQAGFKNVVATSGTAITEDQLKILNRYSGEIAFSFDRDTAGENAMKKAVRIALSSDINSKIISLSGPFKDPDEAIAADPKNWERAVKSAKPSLEFWIDLLINKNPDLSVLTKKSIAKAILPVIKIIFSDIEKEYYIKYLAKRLSVSEKAISSALEKAKPAELAGKSQNTEILTQNLSISEKILGIFWHLPELAGDFKSKIDLLSSQSQKIDAFIKKIKKEGGLKKDGVDPETAVMLSQYEMIITSEFDQADKESCENELKFLFSRLNSDEKEHLKSSFAQKIQEAEEGGDKEKTKELLKEFSSLIK